MFCSGKSNVLEPTAKKPNTYSLSDPISISHCKHYAKRIHETPERQSQKFQTKLLRISKTAPLVAVAKRSTLVVLAELFMNLCK